MSRPDPAESVVPPAAASSSVPPPPTRPSGRRLMADGRQPKQNDARPRNQTALRLWFHRPSRANSIKRANTPLSVSQAIRRAETNGNEKKRNETKKKLNETSRLQPSAGNVSETTAHESALMSAVDVVVDSINCPLNLPASGAHLRPQPRPRPRSERRHVTCNN